MNEIILHKLMTTHNTDTQSLEIKTIMEKIWSMIQCG